VPTTLCVSCMRMRVSGMPVERRWCDLLCSIDTRAQPRGACERAHRAWNTVEGCPNSHHSGMLMRCVQCGISDAVREAVNVVVLATLICVRVFRVVLQVVDKKELLGHVFWVGHQNCSLV
jgi:hypothetical protein